jgi:hypothetical protein
LCHDCAGIPYQEKKKKAFIRQGTGNEDNS